MILPANFKDLSDEEFVQALIEEGYTEDSARYIMGKVRGKIQDKNILQ